MLLTQHLAASLFYIRGTTTRPCGLSYIIEKESTSLPLTWALAGDTMIMWWQSMHERLCVAKRGIA